MTEGDRSGAFGAIYLPALKRIRNLWIDLEPLVTDTSYDDIVAPTRLHLELSDGIENADSARFDIQWSELGMYSFHYIDSDGVNWRFDRHPNTHSPKKHFHSPPEATEAVPSCIDVTEVSLVTRAVCLSWRLAYNRDDHSIVNSLSNPP